jgi:glycosyltransferase involved in cell wall biosynthesis
VTLPVVSAVIATRDRPELVLEAIDGVLSQDYAGEVECMVVYDQSAPDPSLARSGERRSVRVVENSRSPGLAGARNSGILAARGDVVAFCDDDDIWLPGKLSSQVAELDDPDTLLVTGGISVLYAGTSHDRVLATDRVTFAELLRDRRTELHPSTFVMRRAEVLGRLGLVDESVPGGYGEDYEFLLRAARLAPVVHVRRPVTTVRWSGQSYFSGRWETMADGLSWLLSAYPEFESQPSGSARVRGQVAFARAASGSRAEALRWAGSALRRNRREPRAVLAAAVVLGLVSPRRVVEQLHRRGRGI